MRLQRLLRATIIASIAIASASGCATSQTPAPVAPTEAPSTAADATGETTPKTVIVAGDFVSRSRGEVGGLLLLWPRIIPSATATEHTALGAALQERLRAMLAKAFPDRPLDVRPEGERVCLRTGCLAASIGVLIIVADTQCVAVVSVTAPGVADHALMPWAGTVSTALSVPFREPLESFVKVGDMVPCDKLTEVTLDREEKVRQAIEAIR